MIYVEGEGCDRRLLEKTKIIQYLKINNYKFTSRPSQADYILLVTCAFKKEEEDFSFARLKALQHYRGRLLVYGCLPDIAPHRLEGLAAIHKISPKELSRIDEFFDGVKVKYAEVMNPHSISNSPRAVLFQKLRRHLFNHDFMVNRILHFHDFFVRPGEYYYLMVSRGCLGKCTYCAIRRAVGAVKSNPISAIQEEFRTGLAAGFKDYVLLGDDLGSYGLDGPGTLPVLMDSLQAEFQSFRNSRANSEGDEPVARFHLKEVHPKYLFRYEGDLSRILKPGNVMSLLCPIQTGSPRILGLMQREHTVDDIRRLIGKIRDISPQTELSTQIIAGFPTETEEDFEATLKLVAEMRFRWVVIFPYDRKLDTPAADLKGQVPIELIQKRVKKGIRYFRKRKVKPLTSCPW
jgi:MiaB/RimO family radical SAM methylthiotransferase